jgi:hypothetical protein
LDALTAYAAHSQVLAAAGVRQLASLEFEDEEVASLAVTVRRDGSCEYTVANADGMPIGGGSL